MRLSYLVDIHVEDVSKLARLVVSVEVDMVLLGSCWIAQYAFFCPTPGLAAMPNARCPSCSKAFPNHTRLLQHMNQPRGRCVAGRILTNPRSFSFPDLHADSDTGGDDNDDWEDIDAGLDLPVNDMDIDLGLEAPDFTRETQIGEPDSFTEWYPGASVNYGGGHTFMDTFDADQFSSERQSNLFYPFASKAEWEFASWLANSGLSMAAIDKCLALDIVCSSPHSQRALTLYSRSNHFFFLFEQRKGFASSLSCCLLDLGGSVSLLNPSRPRNQTSNYSTETPSNVFNTLYTRRPSMDR